jgi:hypothetical protein
MSNFKQKEFYIPRVSNQCPESFIGGSFIKGAFTSGVEAATRLEKRVGQ